MRRIFGAGSVKETEKIILLFSDFGVARYSLMVQNPLRDSLLWVRIWVKGWPMFLPILFLAQKVRKTTVF